jgi:CubicO group peptidase (beta-lactamase class C family)
VGTPDGEVLAEPVVLTVGPWATRLLPDLADIVKVATLSLIWFIPRHIEMFAPGRFPGFMRDLHDVHAFGIPSLDGYSVATALSGNGFKFAPVWGETLADLAAKGEATFTNDAFTIDAYRALVGLGPAESPLSGVGQGLGLSVLLDPALAGYAGSPGEFGWGGAASTVFWVDPALELVVVFMTQALPAAALPIRSKLHQLVMRALA